MTTAQPNVIIVLTDDQGYGDMSCHGHPVLHTPNMDRLHDESVRLTDFHVCPMCAPTRGEIMSGVHCVPNGAMATSLGRHLLKPELPTMADLFGAAGYATGIFGKWHLGDSYPFRPMDRGFQEAVYHHGFGLTGADSYWNNDYLNPYYRHNGVLEQAEGYCTDFWFDRAMAWMAGRREEGRPFLCYIPTNVPHFPMWVDDVYKEEFAAYGEDPAGFFGMIVELDQNLERLERFLVEKGLRRDTILLFMTDNGHAGGALDVYNAGMRGGKCSRYDGGHRVPFFMRWPGGGLAHERDLDTPARATDVLPTLLDLCGIAPPEGGLLRRAEPGAAAARPAARAGGADAGRPGPPELDRQRRCGRAVETVAAGVRQGTLRHPRGPGTGARRGGRTSGRGRRHARVLRTVVGRGRARHRRLQPGHHRLGARGNGDADELRVGGRALRRRR